METAAQKERKAEDEVGFHRSTYRSKGNMRDRKPIARQLTVNATGRSANGRRR
jgi:hypothetical protein